MGSPLPACSVPAIEVLLIQENPADAFAVRRCLGNAPCSVHVESVVRLDSALTVLRMRRFDLVILDVAEDPSLAKLQKLITRGPEIPVVAIGEWTSEEWQEKILACGACDYVPKDVLSPLLGVAVSSVARMIHQATAATA